MYNLWYVVKLFLARNLQFWLSNCSNIYFKQEEILLLEELLLTDSALTSI